MNFNSVYGDRSVSSQACDPDEAAVWIVTVKRSTTHLSPRHENPWQSFLRLCYSAKLSTRVTVTVCFHVTLW